MKRLSVVLAVLGSLASGLWAQSSSVLDRYVEEGLAKNFAVRAEKIQVEKARSEAALAKGILKPSVGFEANYTVAGGGRRIDFPIGDLLNPAYAALNQLTQSSNFPQLQNQQINFLPNDFQETKLQFAWPVFNESARFNADIKKSLVEVAEKGRERAEQALRSSATEAYLAYLQSLEAERIVMDSKALLAEYLKLNEAFVRNDVATNDVVAAAEFELSKAENALFSLKKKQKTARAAFNRIVGRPLDSPVESDTAWLRRPPVALEKSALLAESKSRRAELRQLRAALSASDLNVAFNDKNRRLPSAYFGGEAGFQGYGYHFFDKQAFALARVGLKYSLYEGGQKNERLQIAELERQALQNQFAEAEQAIELQLEAASNDFEAASFSLASAQKGIAAAEAALKIVSAKYWQRQALFIELLAAQTRLQQAREQLLQSQIEALRKEAALRSAAGL